MHLFHTEHASKQFHQRYHRFVSKMDWIASFLDVIEGRALYLGHADLGRERYLVRVGTVETIVIYDPMMARFVTALPRHRDKIVKRRQGPRRLFDE